MRFPAWDRSALGDIFWQKLRVGPFSCIFVLMLIAGCDLNLVATPTVDAKMVKVPAGWFVMGDDSGPAPSRPARRVYLDAFLIDLAEVTVGDFKRYVEITGRNPLVWEHGIPDTRNDVPVTGILWREADAYCSWLNKRLPTEAEWEKAARGTDGRTYPWGNVWDVARANTAASGKGTVVSVASYPGGVSPYGAMDMAGNAQEWVSDYYDPAYYTYGPDSNPPGVAQVLDHVLRGGSWDSPSHQVTCYFRNASHSAQPNPRVGFRCARAGD